MISAATLEARTVRSRSGAVMIEATLKEDDKIKQQNIFSIDAFIAILRGAEYTEDKATICRVESTPPGYIDGFVSSKEGTIGAVFYVPPQKHQFVLAEYGRYKRKSYFMPMPGLVYMALFNKGVLASFYCFAVKDGKDEVSDETVLCQYPFGNVSCEGSVCMGTVKRRGVKNFWDVRELIEDSLLGETNSDYLEGDKARVLANLTQHQLCEKLKKMEEFPSELLLSYCGSGAKTIGALRKKLFISAESMKL